MLAKKMSAETPKNPDTDLFLVKRLLDPEQKESAFREFVAIYQERIYWHVRRMVLFHEDADDIVQDVFIKIWQNIEKFRGGSTLYTWIYRIATNETLTFLKKQSKREQRLQAGDYDMLASKLQDDSYFSGDEIQHKLQMAILSLPDKQRLVFNMKYYEDMKYEEIASITATSVGALKASYHHAIKKIRKYIELD